MAAAPLAKWERWGDLRGGACCLTGPCHKPVSVTFSLPFSLAGLRVAAARRPRATVSRSARLSRSCSRSDGRAFWATGKGTRTRAQSRRRVDAVDMAQHSDRCLRQLAACSVHTKLPATSSGKSARTAQWDLTSHNVFVGNPHTAGILLSKSVSYTSRKKRPPPSVLRSLGFFLSEGVQGWSWRRSQISQARYSGAINQCSLRQVEKWVLCFRLRNFLAALYLHTAI